MIGAGLPTPSLLEPKVSVEDGGVGRPAPIGPKVRIRKDLAEGSDRLFATERCPALVL